MNGSVEQPWSFQAEAGKKDAIYATASGPIGVAVLDGILKGAVLKVGFFDPTEPKWAISLKGSKDALAAHYLCMSLWQRLSP